MIIYVEDGKIVVSGGLPNFDSEYPVGRGVGPTPREALLLQLQKPRGDEECDHSMAEKILCVYLRSIGESELANAWEKAKDVQNWWYA